VRVCGFTYELLSMFGPPRYTCSLFVDITYESVKTSGLGIPPIRTVLRTLKNEENVARSTIIFLKGAARYYSNLLFRIAFSISG